MNINWLLVKKVQNLLKNCVTTIVLRFPIRNRKRQITHSWTCYQFLKYSGLDQRLMSVRDILNCPLCRSLVLLSAPSTGKLYPIVTSRHKGILFSEWFMKWISNARTSGRIIRLTSVWITPTTLHRIVINQQRRYIGCVLAEPA